MLELKERKYGNYEVLVSINRKPIGECLLEDDGYYYFWSYSDGGWTEHALREVARLLGGLNLEWNEHLSKTLK